MIKSINSSLNSQTDICVFYENQVLPVEQPKFLSTIIADAYNYDGILIATSLSNAYKLIKFPGTTQKYFYITDFEWIKIKGKQYEEIAEIYQHKDLKLITKNDYYKKMIENCWGANVVGLVENFNIEQIKKVTMVL